MPETFTPPEIVSSTQTLLTSGLASAPSIAPLGSIQSNFEGSSQYSVVFQAYIPDSCAVLLDPNITTIEQCLTQAGDLELRQFNLSYSSLIDPLATTFSLWLFDIVYNVNDGPSAQGIYINISGLLYGVDIVSVPVPTKRGTVFIVATT